MLPSSQIDIDSEEELQHMTKITLTFCWANPLLSKGIAAERRHGNARARARARVS